VKVPTANAKQTLGVETTFDSGPLAGVLSKRADVPIE
jgi:hypothetical protein